MTWFLYFSLSIILLSFLCSLRIFTIRYPIVSPANVPGIYTFLKAFSYFMLFTVVGESFGVAWPRVLYHLTPFSRSNQWFYTIFHFFTYLFYLWFYSRVLQIHRVKKIIRIFFPLYITAAILNYTLIQGPFQLNTFTDLVACFMMVFLAIAYYYQLIQAGEYFPLQLQPLFWISTGLLTYHLGSMMGLFLINVMNAISEEKALSILVIIQISAVLMYLNYSIAFLCMRKR